MGRLFYGDLREYWGTYNKMKTGLRTIQTTLVRWNERRTQKRRKNINGQEEVEEFRCCGDGP